MCSAENHAANGAPAKVPQFYGHEMFEHYQEDGYLIVVTSDATAIQLEPGDFIVKRVWSTAVVPYVYDRAATAPIPPGSSDDVKPA